MNTIMKCGLSLAAATIGVVLSSGSARAEQIVVSNFGVAANGMPYAVAMEKGFFKEAGADITGILSSAGGGTTVRNLLTGNLPYGEIDLAGTVAAIQQGLQARLYLGNLDAKRDWGHARDYVEAMWLITQRREPGDYVVATGETHTVREFVELAFGEIGRKITWQGAGTQERGVDAKSGEVLVSVDPRYFRPTEVDFLQGDPAKARAELGWRHKTSFRELVVEMVAADQRAVKEEHERSRRER